MLEILFIPGMVVGIIAVIMMAVGVIFAYKDFGTTIGSIYLASTSIVTAGSVWWAFRTNVWRKIGVKSAIDSKADKYSGVKLEVGMKGTTNSRLNPMGKVMFEDALIEAHSREGFIDQGKTVVITEVLQNKIFVKVC